MPDVFILLLVILGGIGMMVWEFILLYLFLTLGWFAIAWAFAPVVIAILIKRPH